MLKVEKNIEEVKMICENVRDEPDLCVPAILDLQDMIKESFGEGFKWGVFLTLASATGITIGYFRPINRIKKHFQKKEES